MEGIKTKGVIKFKCPCCRKGKIVAYEDAAGKSSIQCGRCHAFLLVNYDKMIAEPTSREKKFTKWL